MDPKTLRQIEDDEMFAHLELDIEQIKTLRVAVDEDVPMKMWSRACITRSSLPLLHLLVPSLKRIASWRISVYLGFESFYGIFTFVPIHRNELLQYPWNFHTHAYRTYFRYSCIYICMLVSLRFESSRCMNILIAFDCAAINVEYEYEMSVKNQRCPTWMISEFLASVSLINGRVTDMTSRWHRVKSLSPPPSLPFRVRNEGLTSEASPRPEREISASTCVQCIVIHLHEYRAARGGIVRIVNRERNIRRIIIFEGRAGSLFSSSRVNKLVDVQIY